METSHRQLIFIPGPGMGHIVATVELTKLILRRDTRLSATFLLINDPQVLSYTQSLHFHSNPRLQFLHLPEPQTNHENRPATSNLAPVLAFEYIQNHKPQVKNALLDILASKSRVDGFVVDMFCVDMIDVAKEFGIPTYLFFTSSAAFLSLKLHIQNLYDEQDLDITDYKDSDEEFTVPGYLNRVPAKVLPTTMLDKDGGFGTVLYTARKIRETKGVLINTFQELELSAVESLSDCDGRRYVPPVYPVGPILHLNENNGDDDILNWLDNQPSCSVVFLCFGSLGSFSEAQIKHIAVGLEHSGQRFLWSLKVRPVVNYATLDEVVPPGFLERTLGVGKVIGWAPQVAVLSHPAIGGFVSHCGWNSILESLWFGVPIAAWPMYAEQQVNAFEMIVELGMAIEVKMDFREEMSDEMVVTSVEIERAIKQLMVDKDVEGIREKVKNMKEKSRRALLEGGSSYKYLNFVIQDILQNPSKP